MKKSACYLLFCFVLLITSCNSVGNKPLEFQGIPIEGTTESFSKKLEEKGYKKLECREDNSAIALSGPYWKYDEANIVVHLADLSDEEDTNYVFVYLGDGHSVIDDDYHKLKYELNSKYGDEMTYLSGEMSESWSLENGEVSIERSGGHSIFGSSQLYDNKRIIVTYRSFTKYELDKKTKEEKKMKERTNNL